MNIVVERLVVFIILLLGINNLMYAQQFVVDDADVTEHRAFQIEGWYGQTESWLAPGFSPLPYLELTAGLGYVEDDQGERQASYAFEVKSMFRSYRPNDYSYGLVLGLGTPFERRGRGSFESLYAYLPASISMKDDQLVFHANIGGIYEVEEVVHGDHFHNEDHIHIAWGFRSDVAITDWFTVTTEIFGEDRVRPEIQAGISTSLIPDRLMIVASHGWHTATEIEGLGFTIGLTWTPAPVY